MTRPTRYTENNSNRDWIDEFIATSSAEEVRGAFRFTIGKYLRRYGKKDDPLQEAIKIQDYANRLVEFERELAAPEHIDTQFTAIINRDVRAGEAVYAGDIVSPDVIEPASEMQDDSERMAAIGQNGNGGEHYFKIGDKVRTLFQCKHIPYGSVCEIVSVPSDPLSLHQIAWNGVVVWADPQKLCHEDLQP